VHPEDETGAVGVAVGLKADLGDLVGVHEERLELQRQREALGLRETVNDGLGVGGNLLERAGAVEMLRTADEPDFRSGGIDEGHGERRVRVNGMEEG